MLQDLGFSLEYEQLKPLEFLAPYGTLRSFCNKYNPKNIIFNNLVLKTQCLLKHLFLSYLNLNLRFLCFISKKIFSLVNSK